MSYFGFFLNMFIKNNNKKACRTLPLCSFIKEERLKWKYANQNSQTLPLLILV